MTKFAIILGEPNSINSEILAKSSAIKKECIIFKMTKLNKLNFKCRLSHNNLETPSLAKD